MEKRQEQMRAFVRKRKLKCLACKTKRPSAWGKVGWARKGRYRWPWAICANCLEQRRREGEAMYALDREWETKGRMD